MHIINARNVNSAYRQGLHYLAHEGEQVSMHTGPVLRAPMPVTTIYSRPQERVLMSGQRNANPFVHLFEALWMLNGQQDVKTLEQFADTFEQFTDDGVTFTGAYGHRWRHWPARMDAAYTESDQLKDVINSLRDNPNDRRIVIGIWDPARDLAMDEKGIPHNLTIKVGIVKGRLNIIVFDRSNDVVLATYGANPVHMAFLHEYLAAMINVPIGTYTQVSTDYHCAVIEPYFFSEYYPFVDEELTQHEPYNDMMVHPLVTSRSTFDFELSEFMRFIGQGTPLSSVQVTRVNNYQNRFFPVVAMPMYSAHHYIRTRDYPNALQVLVSVHEHYLNPLPIDWIYASAAWIERQMRLAGLKVVR